MDSHVALRRGPPIWIQLLCTVYFYDSVSHALLCLTTELVYLYFVLAHVKYLHTNLQPDKTAAVELSLTIKTLCWERNKIHVHTAPTITQ
jgi:hypothetical protein